MIPPPPRRICRASTAAAVLANFRVYTRIFKNSGEYRGVYRRKTQNTGKIGHLPVKRKTGETGEAGNKFPLFQV